MSLDAAIQGSAPSAGLGSYRFGVDCASRLDERSHFGVLLVVLLLCSLLADLLPEAVDLVEPRDGVLVQGIDASESLLANSLLVVG